ncbi:MAG TPA: SulP family inorganic anion transporter [Rhizomicrobium sp.]|jgi:MFS superfamily sulfate permease-like transporter
MSPTDIIRRAGARAAEGFVGPGLVPDLVAGLTLAAIAVPEQMATARLGHFSPEAGFLAFIAGTLGFVILGASRTMSVGADSTITPIFAPSVALFALAGSPAYFMLSALLAIMVGVVVLGAGICRMGWISNLLSRPVTAGFLVGISVHILASQLPVLCGLTIGSGETLSRFVELAGQLDHANGYAVLLGLGVLAITAASERVDRKWPGALIGVGVATVVAFALGLERHGVRVLGAIPPPVPHLPALWPSMAEVARLAPLGLLLAMVVMVQSAATTRSFPAGDGAQPDIDRDFVGVGLANLVSGFVGGFPVNASPPRTAIATEAGARSKRCGLAAVLAVALLAIFGSPLLARVPSAALAGVLLFVALRIVQFRLAREVWHASKGEFGLIVATAVAIVVLPIETGVAIGIVLSLLHGMWSATRARVIELKRIPGTSIWWPLEGNADSEEARGVLVVGFQAPLSFLNSEVFRRGLLDAVAHAPAPLRLVVLEASSIVEIDFTAAHVLCDVVQACRAKGARLAIARLESVRAQESMRRFGIVDHLGPENIYRSVFEAVSSIGAAA